MDSFAFSPANSNLLEKYVNISKNLPMGNILILFAAAKCQAEIKQNPKHSLLLPPARLSTVGQELAGPRCQGIAHTPLATSLECSLAVITALRHARQEREIRMGNSPPCIPQAPCNSPVDAPFRINLLDGGVLCVVVLHLWVAQLCPVDVDEDGGAARGVPWGGPAPNLTGASPGAETHSLSVLGRRDARAALSQPLSPFETAGGEEIREGKKGKKNKNPRNETKGSQESLSSS